MLNARGAGSSNARRCGVFWAPVLASALALMAAGCGDSAEDPVEAFVGTWVYTSVAVGSADCPGHSSLDETPTGNKVFARGIGHPIFDMKTVAHPLVDLTPLTLDRNIVCDFTFDVNDAGTLATGVVGQGCALRGGDLFTLTSWTFSLTSATTADEIAKADIASDPNCTYSMMAQLNRVSKD
jgi:hypothetical protein